ncbi:MAG: ANTAR domain-containing protein [Firmicutes bacterium]|nr:ANTAR domain-containing protein [Bacillota bacterium]
MRGGVLIASQQSGCEAVKQLLAGTGYDDITVCGSGAEARRTLSVRDFSLVLVNTPLPDEAGHELAAEAAARCEMGTVLFIKNEFQEEFSARLAPHGVLVLPKPLSKAFFLQTLRLMEVAAYRLYSLKNENIKLKNKLEEVRMVDRAKCILIQYEGLNEQQAHRYIEKRAMDKRQTRREVAAAVIEEHANI